MADRLHVNVPVPPEGEVQARLRLRDGSGDWVSSIERQQTLTVRTFIEPTMTNPYEILRGVYPECNEWAQDDNRRLQ
jgi:hypothetical protein